MMENIFKFSSLIFTIYFFLNFKNASCVSQLKGYVLDAGDVIRCCSSPINSRERDHPAIYCYNGRPKHLIHLFETVVLEVSLQPEQYTVFEGCNEEEVMKEFESRQYVWDVDFFNWKGKDVRLNPFNNTCVGIVTSRNYHVELNVIRFDYWRLLLMIGGLFLFYFGPRLSKNALFYYICGILFGVFASILILMYIVSRLLPKNPMMVGFMVSGWMMSLYMVHKILDNIRMLSVLYKQYVIGYLITTSILSFAICYRFGPVSNQRSRNLIQWTLQAAGLAMIFYSSHFQEATLMIDIIIFILYNIPSSWSSRMHRTFKSHFNKPRPRLLSEDEYYDQGVRETAKALTELRSFCSSPNCDQWKTVIKLKDPIRFAQFVQGNSHLDDGEILSFETEANKLLNNDDFFTDDSDG